MLCAKIARKPDEFIAFRLVYQVVGGSKSACSGFAFGFRLSGFGFVIIVNFYKKNALKCRMKFFCSKKDRFARFFVGVFETSAKAALPRRPS
jgi:hypothetical protein